MCSEYEKQKFVPNQMVFLKFRTSVQVVNNNVNFSIICTYEKKQILQSNFIFTHNQ